ncbi:MAG: WD40 repeat domain-containing protein, partial [Anaerolineae bacterium]|nr:WD40 repeat domain-containing protein [Anaerolineae bacterium]
MRRLMIIMLCLPFVFITHAQTDSPPPRPIITPENAHQLTQITQLGRGRILDVAFSEDESTLLVASTIGIWAYDMTDLSAEPIWTEIYLGGRGDYLSPNGRYIIINNVDRRGFKIYDIIRRQVVLEDDLQIDSSIFSPKSDRLAVRQSNRIYVVDIPTGYTSFYFDVPNHVDYVSHMRFSPDGKLLATVFVFEDDEVSNELWIWDIATGMEIRHFQISDTSDIEWSPDGETFIMNGGEDVHVRLISATTGLDRQIFTSRFGPPLGGELSFSSDGQQVALASDSVVVYGSAPYNPQGIIYIWNVNFSEPMVILSGHVNRLDKAIFSPSGHYVSGVGSDGMLRIWDARNGEILAHIREHAFN